MNVHASLMTTGEDHPRRSPAERLVCRPLGVRLAAAYIGGFLTFGAFGIAGAAISGAVFLTGIPVIVYAAIRGFRIALVADESNIVIRNHFRTYRLRWDEVAEVGLGFEALWGEPTDAVYFRRKGRRLPVTAQATMFNAAECERALRELRQLRPDIPVHGTT